jgi:glycogen synthase kinase 3 beta
LKKEGDGLGIVRQSTRLAGPRQLTGHACTGQVFHGQTPSSALDLIAKTLSYTPMSRLTAKAAMAHPFFDELRDPATRMPNGAPLPPLLLNP